MNGRITSMEQLSGRLLLWHKLGCVHKIAVTTGTNGIYLLWFATILPAKH